MGRSSRRAARKATRKAPKEVSKRVSKHAARNEAVTVKGTGTFSAANDGFGFVKDEERGVEYFVPRKYVGNAIDGDRVSYAMVHERESFGRGGFRGGHTAPVVKVVDVLEHTREFIVGRLDTPHTMTPLNRHLPETIRLNSVPREAKRGDWVKARLLPDGGRHTETLRGAVEDVIGASGTVEGDIDAIVAEYHLPPAYTPAETEAAMKLEPIEIEREDLTKLYTVTIDPADAHDFDDAISITQGKKATEVILGVHIADVATWVRPNTKFDKAASRRGFSAYLPGRFLPMLPKALTAKISMTEGMACPAHSVIFTIRKKDGKILDTRRVHSLVKVDQRLDYDSLQTYYDKGDVPKGWGKKVREHVDLLKEVYEKLHARRAKEEQFLFIDTKEIRVLCDEETHKIEGISVRSQNTAERIVEECMLAANSAVAAELIERNVAGLFRTHPDPDPEKLEEFSIFFYEMYGMETGDLSSGRKACQDFLAKIPDDARKPVVLSKFLRTMARAVYSDIRGFHFGLGKELYSHFTSPIRRYPDLALHQQLLAIDMNTRMRSRNTFERIAMEANKWEEQVDAAYFAVNDRLKLHWLKQNGALEQSTLYEGVIRKVSAGGLLCDIVDLGIVGSVPADRMYGSGFHYSGSRNHVRAGRGHSEYKVGDFIYLGLDSVDLVRGTAQFRCIV